MLKSAHGAFTLMEVLLAIALIAAMAGFAAIGTAVFSERPLKSRPPDRVFLSALKLGQSEAAAKGRKMSLRYDDGAFVIEDASDKSIVAKVWLSPEIEEAAKAKQQDIGIEIPKADVAVSIVPQYPEVIGSVSVEFPDENLACIEISPDGTCTPANVSFSLGGEDPFTIVLDPVSAAQLEIRK